MPPSSLKKKSPSIDISDVDKEKKRKKSVEFKEQLTENIPPPKVQDLGPLTLTKNRSSNRGKGSIEYSKENAVLRPFLESGSYKNVENNVHSRK